MIDRPRVSGCRAPISGRETRRAESCLLTAGTNAEATNRLRIVTAKIGRDRLLGVAMLSSVLRSSRAVGVNIAIMRAFVRLRHMIASNSEPAKRLEALEVKYDEQFTVVFEAIRDLMIPRSSATRRIGFVAR